MTFKRTSLTSEQNMWLSAFKQAHGSKSGQLKLPCADPREANRVRIALYRTKKQFMANQNLRQEYPEFAAACDDTSISFDKQTGKLVIYRTDASDFNKRMMALLGIGEGENVVPAPKSEQEGQEKIKKLMEELESEEKGEGREKEAGKFVNPYEHVLRED